MKTKIIFYGALVSLFCWIVYPKPHRPVIRKTIPSNCLAIEEWDDSTRAVYEIDKAQNLLIRRLYVGKRPVQIAIAPYKPLHLPDSLREKFRELLKPRSIDYRDYFTNPLYVSIY